MLSQLLDVEFGLDLFPGDAGLFRVPCDCVAQLHEIFHVFKTLLKTAYFGGQRFQRRLFECGGVTHKLLFYLLRMTGNQPSVLPLSWQAHERRARSSLPNTRHLVRGDGVPSPQLRGGLFRRVCIKLSDRKLILHGTRRAAMEPAKGSIAGVEVSNMGIAEGVYQSWESHAVR
jgi:hypothetical protein